MLDLISSAEGLSPQWTESEVSAALSCLHRRNSIAPDGTCAEIITVVYLTKKNHFIDFINNLAADLASRSITSLSFMPNLHSGIPERNALTWISPDTSLRSTVPRERERERKRERDEECER
jgi:hypothetical protein